MCATKLAVDQGRFQAVDQGTPDIKQEFTRSQLFPLHDSKRFEPGDPETFDIVRRLVQQRGNASVPLETRLRAVC